MKDIKRIRRDFHLAAWVMPQGWDLGVQWGVGGKKKFFSEIQPNLVCELLTKSNQINFIGIKSSHRAVTSHMYTVTQEQSQT